MKNALMLWLGLLLLGACTQRMICPAYQSSFIHDQETLRKKFSYFKEDSTPKILTASKNKYLIAVPESYRKKLRNLQTVEMKPVYPVIPDSLKLDHEKDMLMAERDVIDSAAAPPTDSVYAITKTKEKYNLDQDLYMWYFRDLLVLPDVRAAMEQKKKGKEEQRAQDGTGKKKKKGFFDFLKRKPSDSTAVDAPVMEESDSTRARPAKKGLGGLFGRKKEVKAKDTVPKKDPAKKEDEDDGF